MARWNKKTQDRAVEVIDNAINEMKNMQATVERLHAENSELRRLNCILTLQLFDNQC